MGDASPGRVAGGLRLPDRQCPSGAGLEFLAERRLVDRRGAHSRRSASMVPIVADRRMSGACRARAVPMSLSVWAETRAAKCNSMRRLVWRCFIRRVLWVRPSCVDTRTHNRRELCGRRISVAGALGALVLPIFQWRVSGCVDGRSSAPQSGSGTARPGRSADCRPNDRRCAALPRRSNQCALPH